MQSMSVDDQRSLVVRNSTVSENSSSEAEKSDAKPLTISGDPQVEIYKFVLEVDDKDLLLDTVEYKSYSNLRRGGNARVELLAVSIDGPEIIYVYSLDKSVLQNAVTISDEKVVKNGQPALLETDNLTARATFFKEGINSKLVLEGAVSKPREFVRRASGAFVKLPEGDMRGAPEK